MRVDTVLVREPSSLADGIKSVAPASAALNALVLMSLGLEHLSLTLLLNAVSEAGVQCPVYVTETYGILGYDEGAGRNVELMEKGRGLEYGFVGGSGGQGCLVLAYSGGAAAGHTAAARHQRDIGRRPPQRVKLSGNPPIEVGAARSFTSCLIGSIVSSNRLLATRMTVDL